MELIWPKFKIQILLFACVFSLAKSEEKSQVDRTNEFLTNLRLTHFDDWDGNTACPVGKYLTGIKLRYEEVENAGSAENGHKSNTNTVTGFEITCSDSIFLNKDTTVTTAFGKSGKWGKPIVCKTGFAVGISSKLTPPLINAFHTISSILSLKLHCSDDLETSRLRTAQEQIRDLQPDSSSSEFIQFCIAGDAAAGISIKADSIITFFKGDTASIKGIGMECRPVDNPSSNCILTFDWENRSGLKCQMPVDNIKRQEKAISEAETSNGKCAFETWVGIGPNNYIKDVTHAIKSYESIQINNDAEFVKSNILEKLSDFHTKRWFRNHFPDEPNLLTKFVRSLLWKNRQNITGDANFQFQEPMIPNNMFDQFKSQVHVKDEPVLQQLIGRCSIYKIAFNHYRTKHHVYFDYPIKKRMTRIVFET